MHLSCENRAVRSVCNVEPVNLFENVRLKAVVLIQGAGLPPPSPIGNVSGVDNQVAGDFALETGRPLYLTRWTAGVLINEIGLSGKCSWIGEQVSLEDPATPEKPGSRYSG